MVAIILQLFAACLMNPRVTHGFSKNTLIGLRKNSINAPVRNVNSLRKSTAASENVEGEKLQFSSRSLAVQALIEPKRRTKKATELSPISRLESHPDFISHQSQRDKSFARLLVSSTTRRLGQIDAVLTHCCNGKYPPTKGKYAPVVQACLRLGTTQILFLDTPDHAAVKETVGLLRTKRFKAP